MVQTPRTLALISVLTALQVIVGSLLSIQFLTTKIVFTFVVLALSAQLVGMWPTAISAVLANLLGSLLFPKYAFFPGFILTAFLVGLTYGYFLQVRVTWGRIIAANFVAMLGFNLILNTLWLHLLYHIRIPVLLATRLPQEIIMFVVSTVMLVGLFRLPVTAKIIESERERW